MTYNFDPDQWYENELEAIRSKYIAGEITKQEYKKAEKELGKKHDDMWERLDGSYQISQ